ncbi:MFS transporter [Amycolatopsis acidiphila]|uniref:MFS transporter n=1 Tax=Amycolatopsis acidiphila TaxID=715473 RepID=A0A558ACQ7_9PSEU|nr:MFS transporter [Amycolatopsis acidiphila]TVT22025.1 MFS transporter [Amycolatopsis acidiphila]UIJ63656.1 MFS transporter [Amycolatopsis acidiphila]GHG67639.1 MFS transporter [Amycolatopsis acidiphila]
MSLTTGPKRRTAVHTPSLTPGTRIATAIAVCVAQVGLAIPAVLNGLFQQDLGTTSSQLTWISDAFLVPVTLLELTFGVLGDIFGRKRLLIGGSLLLAIGEIVSVLTPGAGVPADARVAVLWIGQALAGIGAAVLFPTSLAMVAAGTHTVQARARGIAIWAAALSTGGFVSPLLGGLVTKIGWGADPNATWRWAFVAVCVLALISAGVACTARNSSAPEGRSLDWPGQITIAVALFALLFAVIQGATSGWSDGWVIGGFVFAVVFLALFVLAERRSAAPLLRLDLFRNRAFAVNSIVTVIGMFSFLGTAYATSIRLSAIQEFSPMKTAIAFVLLQGFALVLMPLTARVIHQYNPRWALGAGFLLIGAGDLWISTQSVTSMSILPIIAPLVLIGIGFAFALSGVTAVAVNTVPNHLAGMASGTTSQLRDFGFTLGPAVIGAIALSQAASQIQGKLAGSDTLRAALAKFDGLPGQVPEGERATVEAAVGAVNSGPLGANAVPSSIPGPGGAPMPFNPLKDVAYHALDHAYSIGYLVCGIAALVAAALAAAVLRGKADRPMVTEESLHD